MRKLSLAAITVLGLALAAMGQASGQNGDSGLTLQGVPGDAQSGEMPLALQGVPADALKDEGITLFAPSPGFQPATSADNARQVGLTRFPEHPVKEVVLARVRMDNHVPPVDRDLWVVNLDAAGAKVQASGIPRDLSGGAVSEAPWTATVIYELVFVDPQDGAFLYRAQAAKLDE